MSSPSPIGSNYKSWNPTYHGMMISTLLTMAFNLTPPCINCNTGLVVNINTAPITLFHIFCLICMFISCRSIITRQQRGVLNARMWLLYDASIKLCIRLQKDHQRHSYLIHISLVPVAPSTYLSYKIHQSLYIYKSPQLPLSIYTTASKYLHIKVLCAFLP